MSVPAPAVVQPLPHHGMARLVGRRLRDWLPAAAFLVLVIGAWEGLIRWRHVQQFLLPKPSSIATAFWDDRSELLHAGWFTFQEVLGGFALCACFELPAAATANHAAAATTSAAIPPTQYLRCFIQTPFWWDGQS